MICAEYRKVGMAASNSCIELAAALGTMHDVSAYLL